MIVDANSVDDIVAVLKDPVKYPSPVRAVGSNHSTAPCGVADGGTLIRMKMNQILSIGPDSLTVQADAVHLDMAKALRSEEPAVLCEHGNRQPVCRKRCMRGDKRRLLPWRIRAGRLLRHRRQNGAAERRSS